MSEKRYAQGLYQRGSGRAGEHSIKGEGVISNCFYGLSSIGSAHSALKDPLSIAHHLTRVAPPEPPTFPPQAFSSTLGRFW